MNKGPRRNLLIIDDDPGFLDLIADVCRNFDFDVTCASEPVEAVSAMKRKKFGVVLLDYQLPIVNGNDLIASLQDINPDSRFIVLTGMGGDEIESQFRGRGYYAFFEKGNLQIEKLKDKIDEAFG